MAHVVWGAVVVIEPLVVVGEFFFFAEMPFTDHGGGVAL